MRSIVTFVLLALLGAIAAILLSNTAPIALTFLGMRTVALPLAVWMGGALGAGAATGFWFLVLFRLAERRGAKREREQRRAEFGPDDFAVVDEGMDSREYATVDGYRDGDYRDDSYQSDDYRDGDYRDRGYDDRNVAYGDYQDRGRGDRATDYGAGQYQPVDRYRDSPSDRSYDRAASTHGQGGKQSSQSSDRYGQDEEFEVVEAQAPVYDANYRVIQPPAPEKEWQGRETASGERYGSEDYSSERYGTEDYSSEGYSSESYTSGQSTSGRSAPSERSESGQKANTESSYSQNKSQPNDDWDIEEDLDW